MKKIAYACFMVLTRWLGSDVIDYRTGKKVAHAFLFCLGGRVYVFGLEGKETIIPVFLPQQRMTFWKREIGFTVHPEVDYPSEPRS